MKPTLDNASKALADPDALTSKTARAYSDLVHKERIRLEGLLNEISDPNQSGNDRWHTTLATGNDADIRALSDEYEKLERDRERRETQYRQFRELERECRQREATAEIPGLLSDLDSKADAVTAARQALEFAYSEFQKTYEQTHKAYTDGQVDKPRPSEALVSKVIQTAEGASFEPRGALYHSATTRPHRVAEALRYSRPQGLDIPQPWRELAKAD